MHGDHARPEVPAVVTLDLWGVPRRAVPGRWPDGRDRGPLRRTPGLRFGKLLGTATAAPSLSAMPTRGTGACWRPGLRRRGAPSRPARPSGVVRDRRERLRVRLRPLASRGSWSRSGPSATRARAYDGPVAAVTRARIRPRGGHILARGASGVGRPAPSAGLQLAVGIGEAPVGLQGTFSLWDSPARADRVRLPRRRPRRGGPAHRRVGWYAEELFARFAVLDVEGTVRRS